MSSRLLLIRHCAASGQAPDAPLTDRGRRSALDLADLLAPMNPARIVASPFTRAIDTIAPLAERTGVRIESESRLRERDLGAIPDPARWQGYLRLSFLNEELCFAGGESAREATTRARVVLDELFSSDHDPTIVVTHGNLLSLIVRSFCGGYAGSEGFHFWRSLRNPDLLWLSNDGSLERVELAAEV